MARCRFYVPRMEFAKIENSTIWGTGSLYGYELLDYNPYSWVSPSGVGVKSARVRVEADIPGDGGSPTSRNFGGAYIYNPDQMIADSGTIKVYGTNSASYSGLVLLTTIYFSANTSEQPIYIDVFGYQSYRFWQIDITPVSVIPRIALLFLGRYWELNTRWDFGDVRSKRYFVERSEPSLGRILTRLHTSRGSWNLGLNFEFLTATELGYLQSVIESTYGSHVPFIYVDDALSTSMIPAEGILARFTDDRLNEAEVVSGLWRVGVGIEELMQHAPGRAY